MSDTTWPSTKGLSVFNALRIVGAMTPEQIHGFLAVHWDPKITPEYVSDGVAFLDDKGWTSRNGEQVALSVPKDKAAVRAGNDSDLRLVTYPYRTGQA